MNIKSIIVLFLLGLFIIVCIQNVENIQMHFLFWAFNISKLLLLILTLIVGLFVGMFIPGLLAKPKNEVKDTQINKS